MVNEGLKSFACCLAFTKSLVFFNIVRKGGDYMDKTKEKLLDSDETSYNNESMVIGVKDVSVARNRSTLVVSDGGGTGGGDSNDTGN